MIKIFLLFLFCYQFENCFSQTIVNSYSHTDSLNRQQIETVMANKANYIGQPLSKLFADVYQPVRFSIPDNIGGNKMAHVNVYYQNFQLYLALSQPSDANYSLSIVLVNKFYVPNLTYRAKEKDGTWNAYLQSIIKDEIVADIRKLTDR